MVIGRNSMESYVWHWIIMLALLSACYLMGIVHTLWLFGIVWGDCVRPFLVQQAFTETLI